MSDTDVVVDHAIDDLEDVETADDADSSSAVAFGVGVVDLVAIGLLCAFVLAFAPPMLFPSWTPRMSLLLAAAIPGVIVLGRHAMKRDPGAVLAATFLVVAVLSALVSHAPRSSLLGFAGRDWSIVMLAASFGLWAIAREVSVEARGLAVSAFTAVGALMAGVGLLQLVLGIRTGPLALLGERPMSFMINPVYYGAISVAVCVVATASAGPRFGWWHVAGAVAACASVISGSRVSWGALIVVLLAQLAIGRTRERTQGVVAAGLGILGAMLLDASSSGGTNTFGRVTDATSGGGADGRSTVWRYSVEAWLERPVLGHGVGLFRPAIQDRFSFDFVRSAGSTELERVWFDAHNLFIAVLVATGLVGLLVLCGWMAVTAAVARGPAAWGVLAIALTWMMQPVSIHTLPIAMLLLGLAMPISATLRLQRPTVRVLGPAALVSVLLAAAVVIGDLSLKRATDDESYPDAVAAARWFPGDSVAASIVAQVARWDSSTLEPNDRSLDWRRQAVEREPDRPLWWNELAVERLQLGDLEAAEAAVEVALELQEVNIRAHVVLLEIAARREDRESVERQLELLCQLNPAGCDVTADEVMGFP